MQAQSSSSNKRETVDVVRFDDISPWARRAGILYPTLVDPALRAEVERQAPVPDDPTDPHEPLFYLLVPLRFVLSRKPSDTCFEYLVGRKWPAGGIAVGVEFHSDELRDNFVALSLAQTARQPWPSVTLSPSD
ncbi:MAG: hypothetical protein H0T51_05310 [Pirellulales bacterium]|nr:hypothetical protein [Pirellulales bacterium]